MEKSLERPTPSARSGRELTLSFLNLIASGQFSLNLRNNIYPKERKIAFFLSGNARTGHIQQLLQLVQSTRGSLKKIFSFLVRL